MTGTSLRKKKKLAPVDGDHSKASIVNQNDRQLKILSQINIFRSLWFVIGLNVCAFAGYLFSQYVTTLHENQMWFTNIQEVEREISLRTECGLYYSYYKQLLSENSIGNGLLNLQFDNATEHGRTINILKRFNVYQEVVLAWLYRQFSSQLEPILFYVYSIFKLNGFYVSVLFALTWYLSKNWTAGLLCAVFYVVNLTDTTRVSFTINLRECFGFPLLWCQIFFVCIFLKRSASISTCKVVVLSYLILIFTGLFTLTWQFNQFIMLIQCGSLYVVGLLRLVVGWKIRLLFLLQAFAVLIAAWAQFWQPMLLGSLLLDFLPAAIISLYVCRHWKLTGGIVTGCLKLVIQTVFTVIMTIVFHTVKRRLLHLDADDHIFKFLKGKFGFVDPRDFESRIYLCHGAFVFLENDFFWRTSYTLLFPLFMLMMCGTLFIVGKDVLSEWCSLIDPRHSKYGPYDSNDPTDKLFYFNQRPELAYLSIQSAASGLLAMMTLRMKYLWTPHMCVLAPILLGDVVMWRKFLSNFKLTKSISWLSIVLTSSLCLLLSSGLIVQYLPTYRAQMNDLKEFYDPDTVELMYWIGNNTKQDASFSGSMQLLAGVKCCTGRHLTNHPHFEDKWLRDRSLQVYQMYGRREPEDVHRILKSIGADYIILEDSICLAKSDGCRLPDLIDLDNGHVPDGGYGSTVYGLKKVETPRFCFEIRYERDRYGRLFKLAMENRTFRVYKVV